MCAARNILYCAQSNCVQYMHSSKPCKPEETDMSRERALQDQRQATGGRDGNAATLDGALDVKLATPKELGGGGGAGNNPEQLFAAGYAACFIGAMKFVASQGGPKVPADATVTSTVGIGPRSEGGFGLDIDLAVSLPGVPQSGCRGPGRESPPGVPVFQRHPRQCGCAPDGRVIRPCGRLSESPNGPPR